jgi:hypothetical protein
LWTVRRIGRWECRPSVMALCEVLTLLDVDEFL